MRSKGVLSFSARWTLIGVSRDIEFDIRNDLLKRLLILEPEFYVRNRTGELMSRATNDLNAVRMVLGPGIMYSATTIITMVLAIAVMVTLSPSLTLWVLLPAPVVAVAVWFFGKTIHELYEKIQAALATLTARVQENLAGVRVVRAYAQEEAEIRGFDEPNREYVSRNIRLIRTWSMFMPSLTALIGTTFLIVLVARRSSGLRGQISLGAFIAFNGYLTVLVWPMIALGWVTNIFQRGAASMGRLNYILTAQPNIDDRDAKVPEGTKPRGEIEFRHLTFAYPTVISGSRFEWRLQTQRQRPSSGASRHQSENSRRLYARHRRPHGQRQDHACRSHCAPLGSAGRLGFDRRAPDPRMAAHHLAPVHRLRPAGHLLVRRDRRRQHRFRTCPSMKSSAFGRQPNLPASTVT